MNEKSRSHVLIVDDTLVNIEVLANILNANYRISFATNGEEALALVQRRPVDLILLDVVMPGIDGFEVCRRLKDDPATNDIPIIFLTSLESAADEERGLSLGAGDFIHKPVSAPVVLARVRNHLQFAHSKRDLKRHNDELELLVAERTQEIVRQHQQITSSQDATIMAFCALAEARDYETGNHIRRTQNYVRALAEALRLHPRFRETLTSERIQLLYKSAPLHDVGKVAIPDAILLKPGKLDAQEWEIMKTHCAAGRQAIATAARELIGAEKSFLDIAGEIAHGHHERWNGSGYPQGVEGDAIPVSARLMAVADVYDALTTRRVYKKAFTHENAMAMIEAERGLHFDPDVVDAFLGIADSFQAIARCYQDGATT